MAEQEGLFSALAKAQADFPVIEKSKTGKVKGNGKNGPFEFEYSYADLADILKAILPILSNNGLCLTQPTKVENGIITLITRVTHTSGELIEGEYPVCSITGAHQQMGGALTYARRYGLSSLLAIATDDDVDGQGAETVKEPPKQQPQSQATQDDRTPLQKANGLVGWLQDCTDMGTFQKAETKAKNELKPNIEESDWLRLEAEFNATFNRLSAKQDQKEVA